MQEAESLNKALSQAVLGELRQLDEHAAEETIRGRVTDALSKTVYNETRRRPMIIVIVA
jgi:mRNA degradation ribonuclease J1/J2